MKSLLMGGVNPLPPIPRLKSPSSSQARSNHLGETRIVSRHSNGLDQFFSGIRDCQGLSILDFAGASQANISFITNLGHRIYSEDFLITLDSAFGEGDPADSQSDAQRAGAFARETLGFPEGHFDGALVWDSLQYLSAPLLQLAIERLETILRPGAYMLAFFHADEKAEAVPLYSYRILDGKSLLLAPRGHRKPAQFFNNRGLEKLFQRFESVKFFLTRDSLREVIVRR